MKFNFVAMKKDYAMDMINNWSYEKEYSIYNYANESKDLLEEKNWGFGKFAVLNEKNDLVGELTMDFFKEVADGSEDDGYIDLETFKNTPNETYELWIGFGLRPDLTGKGLGFQFISSCINFAVKHYNYKGDYIRLAVAEFNKRAIKTYEKLGFTVFNTFSAEIEGKEINILWMKKNL